MALLVEYSCKAKPARSPVEVYDTDAYLSDEDQRA